MISIILLVILILLIIGALPLWPYSRGSSSVVDGQPGYTGGWGYYPSGIIGILLIILVVYLLTGHSIGY